MGAVVIQPNRIGHVSLRVRHLQRSADFYRDLFGLQPRQTEPESMVSCVCAPLGDDSSRLCLTLTQGLPAGSEISGLDHFSFVVESEESIDAIYNKAIELSVRATRPRIYAGHYQVFVFDPDGYKIEVRAEERPPLEGD